VARTVFIDENRIRFAKNAPTILPAHVAHRPAQRVEGPDREPAARKSATLVAVQREKPRGQLRERARVRISSRILGAVHEPGERGGEEVMARAADTDEIDLRLRHRVRELAGLRVGGSRHSARQVLNYGRGRGVGKNRLAQAVA
jgi:hypothetical protein